MCVCSRTDLSVNGPTDTGINSYIMPTLHSMLNCVSSYGNSLIGSSCARGLQRKWSQGGSEITQGKQTGDRSSLARVRSQAESHRGEFQPDSYVYSSRSSRATQVTNFRECLDLSGTCSKAGSSC